MKKILLALFTLIFFCMTAAAVNAAELNNDLTIQLKIDSPVMLVNNEEKKLTKTVPCLL